MKDENPNKSYKNKVSMEDNPKKGVDPYRLAIDRIRNKAKVRDFVEDALVADGMDMSVEEVENIVSGMYEHLVKENVDIDNIDFKRSIEEYRKRW